jgi:hypothetical protein
LVAKEEKLVPFVFAATGGPFPTLFMDPFAIILIKLTMFSRSSG